MCFFLLLNLVIGAAQSVKDLRESARGVIGRVEENHEAQSNLKDQLIKFYGVTSRRH